ncbi:MAG: PAS domain-containing protein [Planctomycetota bacterium]
MPSPPDDNLSQDIVTPVGLGDAIVHHGRDVLLLLESNGTIKRVGGSSIQDVGLTADRAVGQKLSSFLHPGDQVLLTGEDVFEALARFDLHHVELRFDLGNGLFQLTAGTITDLRDNADFSGIALSLRSIGKPARQVPNRQLLLQAVEAANSSIVIAQAGQDDLPLVYANEGFRSVTGYDEDEIIGRNCRFLQCRADDANRRDVENTGEFADDEVDQAEALEELRRGIESREFVNVTLRNYRKNGELFYNDLYLTPVSMGGVFAGFIGVQNDVTQRVEAERELRQRGRLLNGFFDSAPLLMAVVQVGASESDIGRYDEGEFDQRRQAARDLYEHDVNSDAGKVARLTSHVELNQAALDHYDC